MTNSILAVASLVFAVGCGSVPAGSGQVVFAHSSGGPAPIITFVTIKSEGVIVLNAGSRPISRRIDRVEAAAIIAAVRTPGMQTALEKLRALGYESGCCDREDVFIEVDRIITEAPVWSSSYEVVDGVLHTEERAVLPAELIELLARVDRIARSAFGARYSYPVIPRQ
jgi:hypothetical protein